MNLSSVHTLLNTKFKLFTFEEEKEDEKLIKKLKSYKISNNLWLFYLKPSKI